MVGRPLIAEGAGGVCVPVNDSQSMLDLIRRLDWPVVIAARTALGTINHTTLTVHELREVVTAAVLRAANGARMAIALVSFGYKYGQPVGLDLVLDVRFIPNPFFVAELRPLTGNDSRVHEYVMAQPESKRFIDEVGRLFDFLIPLYQREGKSYLTVGLGCTGGRHRSPVLARELIKRLESSGVAGTLRDNDIAR